MQEAAFLLLILSGFLLIACIRINVVGSGHVVEETREILPVDMIEVCCGMELYLSQGEEISLRFEAEDNLIEEIIDKRSGTTLSVEFRDSISTNYRPTKPVKVYTTMTDIRGVSVSGGGRVEIGGDVESQLIDLSGGSRFSGTDLISRLTEIRRNGDAVIWVTESLEADLNGGATVEYVGNPQVNSKLSGGSEVKPLGGR